MVLKKRGKYYWLALWDVERKKAKDRQGVRIDKHPGNFPESSGDTRDLVAQQLGNISGKTLQNIKAST